jgi:hypothetical protein
MSLSPYLAELKRAISAQDGMQDIAPSLLFGADIDFACFPFLQDTNSDSYSGLTAMLSCMSLRSVVTLIANEKEPDAACL